jgi:hypothetical protein
MPPYPQKGDKVVMLATVKNQGTDPLPAGTTVKVSFSIDGVVRTWSDDFAGGIPVGGMALACANKGISGGNSWNVDTVSSFTVTATADPDNALAEISKGNNALTVERKVYPPAPKNLALNKKVTVTSVEAAGLEGPNLVDGNYSTRWSSQFFDPQAAVIDLGEVYPVADAVLSWEAAYAREYYLESSVDGNSWTVEKHQLNGAGSTEKIPVGRKARYIRMRGIQRGTVYGYSLYEIEVHEGTVNAAAEQSSTSTPAVFSLEQNYPNPFNPSTTIGVNLPAAAHVSLTVKNALGADIATLMNTDLSAGRYQAVFDGSRYASGVYFCCLKTGAGMFVRKMILMK